MTILLVYIAISPNITKIIFSFRKVSYQWNYYRQICFGSTLAGGTVEHTTIHNMCTLLSIIGEVSGTGVTHYNNRHR